uniref:Uncharacterized protein n=1 Tax=Quercus lobata TaxID=97700 RepID=A0A7N2MT03_QUELO
MQVSSDGLQPNLRRPTFEDVSSSTQWPILSLIVRFGDYVSDQVVAPVRETCAQAVGALFKYMHPTLVHESLNIL